MAGWQMRTLDKKQKSAYMHSRPRHISPIKKKRLNRFVIIPFGMHAEEALRRLSRYDWGGWNGSASGCDCTQRVGQRFSQSNEKYVRLLVINEGKVDPHTMQALPQSL